VRWGLEFVFRLGDVVSERNVSARAVAPGEALPGRDGLRPSLSASLGRRRSVVAFNAEARELAGRPDVGVA